MKPSALIVALSVFVTGCATAPDERASDGATSAVKASAGVPQVAATGATRVPAVEREAGGSPPGEFAGGPEERLKQNQVEVDNSIGDRAFRSDQAKAAAGDAEAALRVAEIYRRGASGVAPNERRMVQWLLHASSLDSGAASYQLYQYFLQLKLDRDAVYFENRAVSQGYTLPPRLDPKRS